MNQPTGDTRRLEERAQAPGRLDQFWTEQLGPQGVTRAKIQTWIKDGLALVDGTAERKPSRKLRGGELLILDIPQPKAKVQAEERDLCVLYQDESLAVVDKEPGLTVHPAPSCPHGTLVNHLLHHFPQLEAMDGERPGIVHRIDKDTSGLLLVALTEPARVALTRAFARRTVEKRYLALVHGVPKKAQGTIEEPIARDPSYKTRMAVQKGGRPAHSAWTTLWTAPDNSASLLEVAIATGRTHQIRVHMAHIGHPLLGDTTYGPAQQAALARRDPLLARLTSRQMLHAWKLGFTHPDSEERMDFLRQPPRDFWRVPLHLIRRVQRVGVVGLPGCGKSAVADILAELGQPVWSADACVADLYQPGQDGWHLLRSRYGERFVPDADSPVDKRALLEAMRGSGLFRRELMEMLYPLVLNRLESFWAANPRARAAFAEVPMLLEAGWLTARAVDLAVGVDCPDELRHARLAARGWESDLIAQVDAWQWPRAKKMGACAHVLDNSGSLESLRGAVRALLETLRAARRKSVREFLAWMRENQLA